MGNISSQGITMHSFEPPYVAPHSLNVMCIEIRGRST